MCEEVREPATQVPKAMVVAVCLNTFAGLLFLIPLLFVLPEISDLLLLAQPVPAIISSAVGNEGGAFALLIPLMVLAILCGIGCTTACARAVWAFARDGAIPGSKLWAKVHTGLDVPLNAMMLSMVIEIVLGVIYFGSSAAFNAFSGVGVICLTTAYATPIVISMLERRKTVKTASFNMGDTLGYVANAIAVGMSNVRIYRSCRSWSLTLCHRLVAPRCPALLHAQHHPRRPGVDELRVCRLLRVQRCFRLLVSCLGP